VEGTTYEAANGKIYSLTCDWYGVDPNDFNIYDWYDIPQCLEACSTDDTCVGINWNPGDDNDGQPECYTFNNFGNGLGSGLPTYRSAALLPPQQCAAIQSPHTASNSVQFSVSCGTTYYDQPPALSQLFNLWDFNACVDTCAQTKNCIAVNWYDYSNGGAQVNNECDLYSQLGDGFGSEVVTQGNSAVTATAQILNDPATCNSYGGYYSNDGKSFQIFCGKELSTSDLGVVYEVQDDYGNLLFSDCMNLCARSNNGEPNVPSGCYAANFVVSDLADGGQVTCTLLNGYGNNYYAQGAQWAMLQDD
jgi:hypothetical protein